MIGAGNFGVARYLKVAPSSNWFQCLSKKDWFHFVYYKICFLLETRTQKYVMMNHMIYQI
jgi:hypothetical protein